jgi:hypothetical protein
MKTEAQEFLYGLLMILLLLGLAIVSAFLLLGCEPKPEVWQGLDPNRAVCTWRDDFGTCIAGGHAFTYVRRSEDDRIVFACAPGAIAPPPEQPKGD